jgi:hypothetical protein
MDRLPPLAVLSTSLASQISPRLCRVISFADTAPLIIGAETIVEFDCNGGVLEFLPGAVSVGNGSSLTFVHCRITGPLLRESNTISERSVKREVSDGGHVVLLECVLELQCEVRD